MPVSSVPRRLSNADTARSEGLDVTRPASARPAVGGRPPTLEDVAARAGVSRALVSIVMRDVPGASEATRERVRAIADELGYRPDSRARLLAGSRTRLLGVTLSLHNPFHADVAEGIYAAAEHSATRWCSSAMTAVADAARGRRHAAVLPLRGAAAARAAGAPRGAERARRTPARGGGRASRRRGPASTPCAPPTRDGIGAGRRASRRARSPPDRARRRRPRAGRRGAAVRLPRGDAPARAGRRTPGDRRPASARRTAPTAARDLAGRRPAGRRDHLQRPQRGRACSTCSPGPASMYPGEISVVGYDDSQIARLPYLRLTTVSQDTGRLVAARRAARGRPARRKYGRRHGHRRHPHLVVRGTTTASTDQPGCAG